jgi:hypothetical protein
MIHAIGQNDLLDPFGTRLGAIDPYYLAPEKRIQSLMRSGLIVSRVSKVTMSRTVCLCGLVACVCLLFCLPVNAQANCWGNVDCPQGRCCTGMWVGLDYRVNMAFCRMKPNCHSQLFLEYLGFCVCLGFVVVEARVFRTNYLHSMTGIERLNASH